MKPTQGDIGAVPCPHCGYANDLRNIHETGVDMAGADMECDGCSKKSRIAGIGERGAIEAVILVALTAGKGAPTSGRVNQCPCPACQSPQDFQPLYQQNLLARGNTITCDRCKAVCTVTMVNQSIPIRLYPLK